MQLKHRAIDWGADVRTFKCRAHNGNFGARRRQGCLLTGRRG